MGEILTQSEIDALISAMVSEGGGTPARPVQGPPMDASGTRRVRTYDFRRPDKFSKDQLRTLHMLHENFARYLTTFFSANFRTMVQMVIGSVDQTSYAEFLRSVSNPSVLTVFSLEPLPGSCVLDINPVVAFPMLDRLFGGPGAALTQVRPLTEIEVSVMHRVVSGSLTALKEAWKNIIDLSPRLEGMETNPLFVQAVGPNELVVSIAIDVRVGEHVGMMTLCLPYLTLEPILGRLSAQNWFAQKARDVSEHDLQALRSRVEKTAVTLTARLSSTQLSVREILDLTPGDVIVLEQPAQHEVTLYVGSRPKFVVRPGIVRGRLAVQVLSTLPDREEDPDEQ